MRLPTPSQHLPKKERFHLEESSLVKESYNQKNLILFYDGKILSETSKKVRDFCIHA